MISVNSIMTVHPTVVNRWIVEIPVISIMSVHPSVVNRWIVDDNSIQYHVSSSVRGK